MNKAIPLLVWLTLLSLLAGSSAAQVTVIPTLPPTSTPSNPVTTSCVNPLATIQAMYDADDRGQFETSLALLTDQVTLTSWAEGANGHHMTEKSLQGKMQVRTVLGDPGLTRTSGKPGAPVFHVEQARASGDKLTFMLEPDRLRANGKPYNDYKVEAEFAGCQIRALTVIELVTWL